MNSEAGKADSDLQALMEMRLSVVVRFGLISEIDFENALCRVEFEPGKFTGWIKWKTGKAGENISWFPPEVGEAVSIISANGDLANAYVERGAFYTNNRQPPSQKASEVYLHLKDGAVLKYDTDTHQLTGSLPAGGRVICEAPAGFTFKGNSRFEGTGHFTKKLSSDDNIEAAKNLRDQTNTVQSIRDVWNSDRGNTYPGSPPSQRME
jgi:phage baseplate assembly protein V